eukprot:3141882-Alexandrium_andersonii.AAC.1
MHKVACCTFAVAASADDARRTCTPAPAPPSRAKACVPAWVGACVRAYVHALVHGCARVHACVRACVR